MNIVRKILATVGVISLLILGIGICWWNGILNPLASADIGPKPIENPERTHIAHHQLTTGDEIIFQGETFDGFLGDGGGTVVVKLAQPLEYSIDAWHPIAEYPAEFGNFLPALQDSDNLVSGTIGSNHTVWCVTQLQRSGEHISNLVVAFYNPETLIVIERILHT
ncbi:MAG: hypothetical protein P1V20_18030 [Verrucomicrobiales bacterium]|nr:hypothetical protein [Verrucomicrobiales bacterium]